MRQGGVAGAKEMKDFLRWGRTLHGLETEFEDSQEQDCTMVVLSCIYTFTTALAYNRPSATFLRYKYHLASPVTVLK